MNQREWWEQVQAMMQNESPEQRAKREAENATQLQNLLAQIQGETCPCCNGKGRITIAKGHKDDA